MSFLSILKKIGSVGLGIERIAGPIASAYIPGAAPVVTQIDNLIKHTQNAIVTVEANDPRDGQGAIKQASVINDFQAGLEETQSILAMSGKTLTFDEVELKSAINDQVSAYNHFAKVKASFKVVDLPPAT